MEKINYWKGLTINDFIVLPARARISFSYNGELGGFYLISILISKYFLILI